MMSTNDLNIVITPIKPALLDAENSSLQVLVRIGVPGDKPRARVPLSVAMVIDRSGSMQGGRLQAAKDGIQQFVSKLHPEDEVCLVAYDDEVSVPLPLTQVQGFRPLLPEILSSIDVGGCTDLHSGWLEGAQQLAPRSGQDRMCRVVLLSDGHANRGIQNIANVCEQVSQLAAAGITTSTVGIGLDFNERLMTEMAIAGQGTAMYGDRSEDLFEPLEAEAALLGSLVWREVTLQVSSRSSRWTVHNPYPSNEPGSWVLPSLATGSEAWVALSIPMERAVYAQTVSLSSSALVVSIRAKDAQGEFHTFSAALPRLPVVSADAYDALPADELVSRRFNELEAAEVQREAYRAASMRNWTKLARMLDALELRAQDNPWLMQTVSVLRELLAQRDQARLEKELMYSSHSLSSRLTEQDELLSFSQRVESEKAAFLRRKVQQGRDSSSRR
jgi:Ca-activated chloride channel family protein